MALTVADIDRWSAEAVREVFHAANARGRATLDASRELSSLAVFDTWEGATAEARKHANASIRQDLDAHGNESLAVAAAAGKAAADIEHVQAELRTLRADAAELHMTIDALTNQVVPSSTFTGSTSVAVVAAMQLQPRLDAIVAEANAVDAELAAAINMADGYAPIPGAPPRDNRPETQGAPPKPLPENLTKPPDLTQRPTTTTGTVAQVPGSNQQAVQPQPGGNNAQGPWWSWTGPDYATTSATAIKSGVNDAAARAFLASPGTGPGKADPGLVKWFENPKIGPVELKGFTRANGALSAAIAVPAVITDVNVDHNSLQKAIAREAGGAAVGLWAGAVGGAEAGALAGSFIPVPGVGTAVGIVAGAAIGGLMATGASKVIGKVWDSFF